MAPSSPTRPSPWKGKAKATLSSPIDPDFIDLEPAITYRHALSNNFGVKDPLRVVALCDSDAFYAMCEMVRLDVDRETPLVVLQWSSIIAVNYPARKYGITRMIKLKEALEKCPSLKVVHVATYREGDSEPGYWEEVDTNTHKVSLDYYRKESARIASVFRESLPASVEIEKASIDEAFFDYTKAVKEILLQRYPYLTKVPEDSPDGVDTLLPPPPRIEWRELSVGHVIPLNGSESEEESKGKSEEERDEGNLGPKAEMAEGSSLLDPEENRDAKSGDEQYALTWHDVALSIAAELMDQARAKVREMGYTTSAGIARNKFLAKLTASYKKPNSQSILRNKAIPAYLKPLPFQKIRFLGGKLGKALAQEYDVSTVGDLLAISLDEMQHKFGENAIWVYEVLRGIDRAEIKEKSALNKSMLASKNLPKPITNAAEGYHWIRVLAAELALRLNDARQVSPSLWPKTIVLHAKKGYQTGRSKQAPFPFTRKLSVDTIADAGDKLWKELVGTNTTVNVSHVQLAFTGIDAAEGGQRSIEGFLKSASTSSPRKRSRNEKHDELTEFHIAVDDVNQKSDIGPDTNIQEILSGSLLSWGCPRCGKTFHLSESLSGVDDGIRQEALSGLRLEHEDFHFAHDLAGQPEGHSSPTGPISRKEGFKPGNAKKKGRNEPQGLDKYFSKK